EQTPPELGADIAERGMMLTGAGALLPVALAHQLSRQTGRPVLALTANDIQQRGAIAVVPRLT
ncbi:rod shape-determining protein, partial [Ralstonia pseudosolanacearum]|uniref:rod shape-determining protein n=1 Tax=Ralstonia pseudosolanacearum TaxID=1310165 RepID=UPI003CEED8B9